jgi:hypothetical protein
MRAVYVALSALPPPSRKRLLLLLLLLQVCEHHQAGFPRQHEARSGPLKVRSLSEALLTIKYY